MAVSMVGQLGDLMVHSWVETKEKRSVLEVAFELVRMSEKQMVVVLVPLEYKLGHV